MEMVVYFGYQMLRALPMNNMEHDNKNNTIKVFIQIMQREG